MPRNINGGDGGNVSELKLGGQEEEQLKTVINAVKDASDKLEGLRQAKRTIGKQAMRNVLEQGFTDIVDEGEVPGHILEQYMDELESE